MNFESMSYVLNLLFFLNWLSARLKFALNSTLMDFHLIFISLIIIFFNLIKFIYFVLFFYFLF